MAVKHSSGFYALGVQAGKTNFYPHLNVNVWNPSSGLPSRNEPAAVEALGWKNLLTSEGKKRLKRNQSAFKVNSIRFKQNCSEA